MQAARGGTRDNEMSRRKQPRETIPTLRSERAKVGTHVSAAQGEVEGGRRPTGAGVW